MQTSQYCCLSLTQRKPMYGMTVTRSSFHAPPLRLLVWQARVEQCADQVVGVTPSRAVGLNV